MKYAPISDYALIGDCHGAALVGKNGSIDWACLTRFDSGGVFCKLLDAEKGGAFYLNWAQLQSSSRRYLPDTNVLETTFVTATGEARVLDCFAMHRGGREAPWKQLLRAIDCVRGQVELEVHIEPRFDYASLHPWLRHHKAERVHSAVGGDDAVVLSTDTSMEPDHDGCCWRAHVTLEEGQRRRFALTATRPHDMQLQYLAAEPFDKRLDGTIDWWRRWIKRGQPHRPEVTRSALTLKLLTCAPTGAIIAAPTTSLPERLGGTRNWDYRYSWIRDSSMTLAALLACGHPEAASRFRNFIQAATAGRADELQIVYGCYGERRLLEVELNHLDGYAGSRPVRAGNDAYTQTQLDVYGEILDAAHLWLQVDDGLDDDFWRFLQGVVNQAAERWHEPDQGLWEMRGPPRHFVYSKVMCWLALERGINLARDHGRECNVDGWIQCRDRIRADIEEKGIDAKRGCFVQAYGTRDLDASLLRLPLVGFVRADDPRMTRTIDAIRQELAVGPLLRRYLEHVDDGLPAGEGAFLMASFWLVDVLSMANRVSEAEELYGQLLALANDVGLFSEECDLYTHEPLGNFPQAFTHLSLINAAEQLRRARGPEDAGQAVAERHSKRAKRGK
jgi:GH15 family glucan-1,4-alpha-glucosidase